jgi:integrase
MARRIDTVEARGKLPARRTPYWVRLVPGLSLGFRKLVAGSNGVWLARVYDAALRKDTWRSLGGFEGLPAHERYAAAKTAAEGLAGHMGRGGSADALSVREACSAYVKHLRAEGKDRTADDARARFKRWIEGDKIADIDVRKLAAHHVRTWRQSLMAAPVTVNPHADPADRRLRPRTPATVNRDMSALRAALNHAMEAGAVTADAAWRLPLRPLPNAERRRGLYLDRAQRAALINSAAPDLSLLLRGLCLVPLRPGALAALTVAGFDKRLGTLSIGKDKAGGERRIKLPPETAAFFAQCSRDKLPAASLFSRAGGQAWDKDAWKKPVKAAALVAGLPANVTAYTLRHSVITDLIGAGLDVLTVARLSGTSISMIERHYGHLRAEHAAAALATLAL